MKNSAVDILLVDDREDGLIALEAILQNPRYNLIKVRSGKDALVEVAKTNFAVILLDVQMPEMDGFETALRIRQMPESKYVPIIFVTAINKDDSYVFKGYQAGAVDYIFKPVDENILRSKVSVFVDLFEKNKRIEEQAQQIKENAQNERYLRLAQLEVENLKRYRNLADSIPHAVWRAKPDGTMDYFNRVWTEYTGLSDNQSMGAGWQAAFHPDDLRLFLKEWMKYIGLAESFQVECRIQNIAGQYRWNIIRVVAECRSDNQVVAWLGTCTDFHERKVIEEKLVKAQQQADAANVAKTNFLANMSHEIRTPLNSILGFTELMLNPNYSVEDQSKSLNTIKKNGQILMKIIDEILDISKVETGHLELDEVETDLPKLISQVFTLLHVQAQEKQIEFHCACDGVIPTKIFTDATRYQQILVNIIGNSLKFTEKGQVDFQMSWHPDRPGSDQGILRCVVHDTGIGMTEEEVKNLFQPFVQVDSSKTRRFGGTGLGLALSRRLARALKGDAYIRQTQKSQGSTFVVDIHTQVTLDSIFVDSVEKYVKEIETTALVNNKAVLQNTRVLVVDDSSDNRDLITQFLQAAGANVDSAADGIDGVKKALENEYEVILMDIQMPLLDGYKATSQLRNLGYSRPIIALTAHALKQERLNSLNAGCDDHLTKPIDRKTLIEQISKHTSTVYKDVSLSEKDIGQKNI